MLNLRSTSALLAAALCGCARQDLSEHERYLEARRTIARVAAAGDARCSEEPACGTALAALAAFEPGSPDHAGASEVLARVDEARRVPAPVQEPLFVVRPDASPPASQPEEPPPAAQPLASPEAQVGTAVIRWTGSGPMPAAPPPRVPVARAEEEDGDGEPGPRGRETPDPSRGPFSCRAIRSEIARRQLRTEIKSSGAATVQVAYAHCPENQPKAERDLDDLESDGTQGARVDEHPEIPHYEALLGDCVEDAVAPPPPPPPCR